MDWKIFELFKGGVSQAGYGFNQQQQQQGQQSMGMQQQFMNQECTNFEETRFGMY